jgi:hypothetical protein
MWKFGLDYVVLLLLCGLSMPRLHAVDIDSISDGEIFIVEHLARDRTVPASLGPIERSISEALAVRAEWVSKIGIAAMSRKQADATSDFVVSGSVFERNTVIHVSGNVQFGQEQFSIYAKVGLTPERINNQQEIVKPLVDSLMKRIYNGLAYKVMAVVISVDSLFKVKGCETDYPVIGKVIPGMLKRALAKFAQITLAGEIAETSIEEAPAAKDLKEDVKTNPSMKLQAGLFIQANYEITGSFAELGGQLWIETVCTRKETKQIVSEQSTIVRHIVLDTLQNALYTVASHIYDDIKTRQFILSKNKTIFNTLAVVSMPPKPNTEDNRRRSVYITSAVTDKLLSCDTDAYEIKEASGRLESFMNQWTNVWNTMSELNVARALTILYEDYENGRFKVEMRLYDIGNTRSSIYSDTKYGWRSEIKEKVDSVVASIIEYYGIDNSRCIEYQSIPVLRVTRPRSIELIPIGYSWNGGNGGPLMDPSNASFALYFFFPPSSPVKRIGPLRLDNDRFKVGFIVSWAWGYRTWENFFQEEAWSVQLWSLYLTGKYNLRFDEDVNTYFGAGFGGLLLRRVAGPGYSIFHGETDFTLGITGITGLEVRLNRQFRLTLPLRGFVGLYQYEEKVYDGFTFRGGRPFGLSFGMGLSISW